MTRRKFGLGARLAIAFAVLAAITAFVTAGVSAYATSRQVNADIDDFLENRSLDIVEGRRADQGRGSRPGPPQRGDDPPPAAEVIQEIRSLVESDAEVQILDRQGNVTIASGVSLPIGAVDERFFEKRSAPLLRTVAIDGEDYRIITRHLEGGGAVQVARSLSSTNVLLGDLRSELLLVGIIMSGLAGLVGWAISQQTTKPLRRLTSTIETVAATEDLSTPVALQRNDEIGRLSEEFDGLLKTLGASRDQQQQLVQDAAHELRTPLTSVRANIDFLERARNLPDSERETTLQSIKAELGELSTVLAEIVELATESRGVANFEELDLATVAEAAIAQFELRSARPVIRKLDASQVRGDHTMLVRAAQNLIGNADKYSPPDKAITIGVAAGALWVADQGDGIEQEDRERVFDRFYRSDRDRSAPGSGLGLAIVQKTAAEHGGRAWADEADGGGARVGFTLPTI